MAPPLSKATQLVLAIPYAKIQAESIWQRTEIERYLGRRGGRGKGRGEEREGQSGRDEEEKGRRQRERREGKRRREETRG